MIRRVLIANRGEIAIRIARAVRDLGWESVAVSGTDDGSGLHTQRTDRHRALPGNGVAAYLDVDAIIAAALDADAQAVHPGYGFLSESADAAEAIIDAGLVWVGPDPAILRRLGDKQAARKEAETVGVPVLEATDDLRTARSLIAAYGGVMVKARHGGGGRGMRAVTDAARLEQAWEQCASEATSAFGSGEVMAEALLQNVRHVEVQVVGDGNRFVHLGDRDCSVQRRHQKVIEVAPAQIDDAVRDGVADAAVRLAEAVGLDNVATVEFLVHDRGFVFLEVNPRLQVEHTVTEMVTGIDIVQVQLRRAAGASLESIGLASPPAVRGVAIECRLNTEAIRPDGTVRPAGGVLTVFEPPTGPGVRTDTHGTAGAAAHPAFDSLLAKVVTHGDSFDEARRSMIRALDEFRVEGIATNRQLLRTLLDHNDYGPRVDTSFFDRILPALAARLGTEHPAPSPVAAAGPEEIDEPETPAVTPDLGDDVGDAVVAPMLGTVVSVDVRPDVAVVAGQQVAVIEAMKMEHVVTAPVGGTVRSVHVVPGATVHDGMVLARIEAGATEDDAPDTATEEIDLDEIRPDLAEVLERHAYTHDERRPDAVAKRHGRGHRTARENLADLLDPGSFIEYGALAIAAQRRRRDVQDLIERTPADGLIAGIGTVDGRPTAVLSYDYTVLAGTQGFLNHRKKDRLFEIIEAQRLPVVFYTEGGGGRPGDTDAPGVAGLDCLAFEYFAQLSALVPIVGIVNGRCFAGNAALLGCCDVVISTEDASIGMGGPAMIEGGGLGVHDPDDVGPAAVQFANGVIDVLVPDEAAATVAAKQYLGYFDPTPTSWTCPDQRALRHVVPENRLRVYDMRAVVSGLVDHDSMLELRAGWGPGIITTLARVEGRPLGIVANDPAHLAGALDPEGCDKAARFLQLCDAHDLPVLFLCDTPGFMVGPDIESQAMVRKAGRLFVTAANLSVPVFTIVTRKGYGLGAQAMAGGSFHAPLFTIGWPTSEFGGMGLEGAVRLGFSKELAAIEDPEAREATYRQMVDRMYEIGKGVNMAAHFEIDAVIDPADSRHWITTTLQSVPPAPVRTGKKRPNIDAS